MATLNQDLTNMKSRLIKFRDMFTQSRVYFTIFKLPAIVFTALFGFILEFIIELPFMVLCMLDRDSQREEDRAPETRGQRTSR